MEGAAPRRAFTTTLNEEKKGILAMQRKNGFMNSYQLQLFSCTNEDFLGE